jgi:hypothetical protein
MLLITTFVELQPEETERGHVAHMPSLDGRCKFTHAMLKPRCSVALSSRFQNCMVVAWQGAAWERCGMRELAFSVVGK